VATDPVTFPSDRKLRVLAIAEAANPEWVSVPLVGWSLASALRAHADVHIVTQIRNRDAFLRAGLKEGTDFTAIDSEAFAKPAWKLAEKLRMGEGKGWTMVQAINALSYPWFERLVWRAFGDSIKAGDWDIVHRITPLSPTIASPITAKVAKANVPFVIGPLNGGVPWPKGFEAERRGEKEWLSYVRSAYKLLPNRTATLKHASAILAGSRHTASEVPEQFQNKTLFLPENGIDPSRFNLTASPSTDTPLRGVFVGRLVPYKGASMLLNAARDLLISGKMVLDIVGDGPQRAELEALAAPMGDAVTFHGWKAHQEVQDIMAKADCLTFPSIREFGGGVVLEAMALGLPPIVVDYAGPGELVSDAWGYKIPCGSKTEIERDLATLLTDLVADPAPLATKGKAAKARVESTFTWDQKARQILRAYDWALDPTVPAPSLITD
jgi:glycosyltransferase involved in cell wall biosynthesis